MQTTAPRRLQLADFHYDLPPRLIAQTPLPERQASRLLVVDGDQRQHRLMAELPTLLRAGDHLVFNDTRVMAARLAGRKATGGKLEMLLERLLSDDHALVKLKASKSPRPGDRLTLHAVGQPSSMPASSPGSMPGSMPAERIEVTVVARHDDLFELAVLPGAANSLADFIEQHGALPLPPYIERAPNDEDLERYQTVFAREPGAVAAPTAGLHFDQALLDALATAGISWSFVTLHVGAGTFQPVRVSDPQQHVMHAERYTVQADTVQAIERARSTGGRVIAVGTTSVRALESAAANDMLAAATGETRLFLTPGCRFRVVDGIITNFHLPESTLLMLVAAFAGLDSTLAAYREAVAQHYRFFSYGDAMLVWPERAG